MSVRHRSTGVGVVKRPRRKSSKNFRPAIVRSPDSECVNSVHEWNPVTRRVSWFVSGVALAHTNVL